MEINAKSGGSEFLRSFIKQRRKRLAVSQQELAKQAGTAIGLVGMIESGSRGGIPRKETLIKLSRALKLPHETAGEVMNFIQLLIQGVIPDGAIREVALGEVRPAQAMIQLTQVPADNDYDMFVPSASKHDRLEQALALLNIDLNPEDYRAIAHLLRRFYDTTSL